MMRDHVIDIAPVLQFKRAMKALRPNRADLPEAAKVRQQVEDSGEDPAHAAVGYLVAVVADALDTSVGDLEPERVGRVLLAEDVLLILTGSADIETARQWLRSP
ncbi:MAG: hypothetical protein GY719_36695 [bacterium]|nr:hypothetical protein [bacterium]